MATVSELTSPPLSGLPYIDALINTGPAWNYLTPASNTIYYTFSVVSGNEAGRSGQSAFSSAQQQWTQYALEKYLAEVTGVHFVLTTDGMAAQLHFSNVDITENSQTTGLCSWQSYYSYSSSNPNQVLTYTANAYVYLDNNEWYAQNQDLSPGGYGYETLLHELGHAMGLKHPFDGDITLPQGQDTTAYTLMSYTYDGGPHSTYSPYDIAALNWIYGGDGLGGALGINSTTGARYITGSNADDALTGTVHDDTLEGDGGNDHLDGGAGIDTAVFHGARSAFAISRLDNGAIVVAGPADSDGTDTLVNVERLQFSDDRAVALDIGGNAGQVYRMYQAALDRAPDLGGFGFWLAQMDHGYSLDQITGLVLANKEATDMYMSDPTDQYFLTELYHHVLHREPDAEGLAWWMQNVQYSSRAHVLALFSESAENQAQVIGSIQNGIDYTPWHGG